MKKEEIKKIKEESEAQILEILDQFTVKTGLYLKEIALLEGPRMEQLYSEVVHVEIKTALPEEVSSRRGITMEDIEKKLKEKGMSSEEIESIKKGNEEKEEVEKIKEKKGTFEIKGFHGFTVVQDLVGCVDVRYKGESVQGMMDVKVRAFNQEDDCPILMLEIRAEDWG